MFAALVLHQVSTLLQAHAHNDYMHAKPLATAMSYGYGSVEADFYLVDGELLVAHDRDQVKAGRTLDALYLKPLAEAVHRHKGSVYGDGKPVVLLLDVKADGSAVVPVLKRQLKRYPDVFGRGKPVLPVVSGDRDIPAITKDPEKVLALDGRLENIGDAADEVPLVSADWGRVFTWSGRGDMPADETARLKDIADRCHKAGQKLRFWGAPDMEKSWGYQLAAGCDLVGTDRLESLATYLRHRKTGTPDGR
ncbi:MAG: hypothetical protein KF857_12135 [Fimbriimonadaceae bacterium]|nr:hypothetical protein [Fimbriimonadaceae bacterium]